MMYRLFIGLTAAIAFFSSCRSTHKIQTAIAKKDTVAVAPVTPTANAHEDSMTFIKDNFAKLRANHIDFQSFSAKIDVDYSDGNGKKINVTAHVRMVKDSVIWISITAILGIEGLRALITPDSVKILDKQNKIYTARSVSYLQEVSALPLTLSSLQDLLIGNPVFLDSSITSYERTGNGIALLDKGTFFKNLLTISDDQKLIQSSKLDDVDVSRNRTCYLTYDDYENKKGPNFSKERTINVTEKTKLDIKLDFRQYDFNETLSFPFSVPEKYKRN